MKNGAKIGMIVMLVLAIALVAAGFMGIQEGERVKNAQPTEYELFQAEAKELISECEGYMAVADKALENISSYRRQLEANRSKLEEAGGDVASADKALATIDEATDSANAAREDMQSRLDKIKTMSETSEDDDAGIKDARNKMPLQRNQIKIKLKTITKIDPEESASNPSGETIARKQCDKIVAEIAESNPELDLGEQFTVTKDATAAANDVSEGPVSLKDFLRENWDYAFWLAGVALVAAALCGLGWKKPELLKKIGSAANKKMMLVALVVITLFFFVATRYKNLTPANIYNVINQYSYIIILATGMLLCIVSSANIDLSVGRVMGFIAACAAKFIIDSNMPVWLAMALCLLIGIAIGAWQGFWIAYMKIPAFVVTLAGQLTFYGLTMVLLKGETKAPFPQNFNNVFGIALPDFIGNAFGINIGINLTTMLIGVLVVVAFILIQLFNRRNRVKKGYAVDAMGATVAKIAIISAVLLWLFYSLASNKGLPTVLITVSLVLLIYTFLTSKTVIGRHLYAMGGNVNAARLSGVKTQRMLFLVYVNMGLLAALAGLAYAVRMNSASPMGGQGEELNAIAACYIGGASAYGGIGTVGGAVIGALTMGMIKNGMSMMGMSQDLQQVVLGLVLLLAVVIDIVSKNGTNSLPFLSNLKGRKEKKAEATAVAAKT